MAYNNEEIEEISKLVHDAWWEEKKRQGFHSPIDCPSSNGCDRCHSDMIPYKDLPEEIKDYDRVTVKAVLAAIAKLEQK